jgi:hypothetical protein
MRLTKNSVEEIQSGPDMRQFRDHLVPELWLIVYPSGVKNWHLCVPTGEKEKIVSIGSYPQVDLREARKEARSWLQDASYSPEPHYFQRDNRRLLDEHKRVKLSQVMKDRESVKFKPNPLFQDQKKITQKASDLRLKEEEQRKFFRQKQEEIEIETAWKTYQKTQNPAILSDLLRSENLINNPLPIEMAREIAHFLDHVTSQSDDASAVDDNRIFMTYWRHTELKNGVAPLLMNSEAVHECVTFMEAIGRPIPYENIEIFLKDRYVEWRKNNSEKLEKSAKVLREMTNKPTEGEDPDDGTDKE